MALAAMTTALKLLNWVPTAVSREGTKRFSSIDDAREMLGLRKIGLPAYFPQQLQWPPAEVFARKRPYEWVMMHFVDRDTKEVVLSIGQGDSADPSPIRSRIEPSAVTGRDSLLLKGRRADLLLATCPDGEACNVLSWKDGDRAFSVISRGRIKELVMVCESMIAE